MQKDNFGLTAAQKNRLLEVQEFTAQAPGTIVRDFEALLSLIGDRGLLATPAHLFAMSALELINQQLAQPLQLGFKRAIQKSYPHINGLYLLLRATGLGLIDTSGKKVWIKRDPQTLESWRSLNQAERYFALLQAWWGRANEELIGERVDWRGTLPMKMQRFVELFLKAGIGDPENGKDVYTLRYYPGWHNLALLELFGLIDIALTPPAEGQGWLPRQMEMTDWGKALLGSYMDFIVEAVKTANMAVWNNPSIGFEQWSRAIRPLIKEWQRDLEIPKPPFQPGPQVFKVRLDPDCWRRIAIRGDATLDQFAGAILQAFGFDDEQMYQFIYRDRFGSVVEIGNPDAFLPQRVTTEGLQVGDLPLFQGMRIEFLYDFDNEWRFMLETESINADLAIKKPKVLERHGQAPEQYPLMGW